MQRIRTGLRREDAIRDGTTPPLPRVSHPLSMIRALLFAFGLVGTLIGCGLFYVDSILLKIRVDESQPHWISLICSTSNGALVVDPAEWLPYTLVGMGALTLLYSIALPVPHYRHSGRFSHHHH